MNVFACYQNIGYLTAVLNIRLYSNPFLYFKHFAKRCWQTILFRFFILSINAFNLLSAVYYQYVHFYGHKTNQLNFLYSFIKIVIRHMFNIEFLIAIMSTYKVKTSKMYHKLGFILWERFTFDRLLSFAWNHYHI